MLLENFETPPVLLSGVSSSLLSGRQGWILPREKLAPAMAEPALLRKKPALAKAVLALARGEPERKELALVRVEPAQAREKPAWEELALAREEPALTSKEPTIA